MSRTFRRCDARYEYAWVLCKWGSRGPGFSRLDARSRAGRAAIARFHSDATETMSSTAPAWYRRVFDHRINTYNNRMLKRWIDDPAFDPVFDVKHRHGANWSWW